jgi:hypothetical protein
MCKIEQLATQESLDFDWSKYLRHAVLLNSATITGVLAKQYLKSATSTVLTCADFLCLAIHEEKGHALHALLNIPEFGQAINTKASNFETINFHTTRMKSVTPPANPSKQEYIPLHHALLKFSCLHEVEPSSRQLGSMELYHENILRTLLRYGADPYTPLAPHRIDNTFALAVDHGCINSVRLVPHQPYLTHSPITHSLTGYYFLLLYRQPASKALHVFDAIPAAISFTSTPRSTTLIHCGAASSHAKRAHYSC